MSLQEDAIDTSCHGGAGEDGSQMSIAGGVTAATAWALRTLPSRWHSLITRAAATWAQPQDTWHLRAAAPEVAATPAADGPRWTAPAQAFRHWVLPEFDMCLAIIRQRLDAQMQPQA